MLRRLDVTPASKHAQKGDTLPFSEQLSRKILGSLEVLNTSLDVARDTVARIDALTSSAGTPLRHATPTSSTKMPASGDSPHVGRALFTPITSRLLQDMSSSGREGDGGSASGAAVSMRSPASAVRGAQHTTSPAGALPTPTKRALSGVPVSRSPTTVVEYSRHDQDHSRDGLEAESKSKVDAAQGPSQGVDTLLRSHVSQVLGDLLASGAVSLGAIPADVLVQLSEWAGPSAVKACATKFGQQQQRIADSRQLAADRARDSVRLEFEEKVRVLQGQLEDARAQAAQAAAELETAKTLAVRADACRLAALRACATQVKQLKAAMVQTKRALETAREECVQDLHVALAGFADFQRHHQTFNAEDDAAAAITAIAASACEDGVVGDDLDEEVARLPTPVDGVPPVLVGEEGSVFLDEPSVLDGELDDDHIGDDERTPGDTVGTAPATPASDGHEEVGVSTPRSRDQDLRGDVDDGSMLDVTSPRDRDEPEHVDEADEDGFDGVMIDTELFEHITVHNGTPAGFVVEHFLATPRASTPSALRPELLPRPHAGTESKPQSAVNKGGVQPAGADGKGDSGSVSSEEGCVGVDEDFAAVLEQQQTASGTEAGGDVVAPSGGGAAATEEDGGAADEETKHEFFELRVV